MLPNSSVRAGDVRMGVCESVQDRLALPGDLTARRELAQLQTEEDKRRGTGLGIRVNGRLAGVKPAPRRSPPWA